MNVIHGVDGMYSHERNHRFRPMWQRGSCPENCLPLVKSCRARQRRKAAQAMTIPFMPV
ncbi:hypothetical protein BD310DRAFT_936462 [Dichomitus squalens]|uniref:Uncharacterized protein n=1 Tax=Dichomitus squalens TaxID=114155 RepID=A0A4Q9PJA0_9APHY|nr:hypothetical protein BD310DRAFT_936462 [Dichomitus squalens]